MIENAAAAAAGWLALKIKYQITVASEVQRQVSAGL